MNLLTFVELYFDGNLMGSTTTDHKPTDRKQRQLAEKGNPKYILLSPEPSCPNPHLVTKSL